MIWTWRLACTLPLVLLLWASPALQGAAALEPEISALVQIRWQDAETRRHLLAVDLPAYARLADDAGPYLVAVVAYDQIEPLRAAGLRVTVLDGDTTRDAYYLAYPRPGLPAPRWQTLGRVVVDGGHQVLLQATPVQAEQIVMGDAAGQVLELAPRPVHLYPLGASEPNTLRPDPRVEAMIDQVSRDTLRRYVGELSGAWPAEVGGRSYRLSTRHTHSGLLYRAAEYAGQHLSRLGLDVEYHTWQAGTAPNVIAELPGAANADRIVILCAHLDSIALDAPASLAPGADDNASGSAAVLAAAEILSRHDWSCTLRFALWTGEEQGMLGSQAYAARSRFSEPKEKIEGVLNLDTIAWNTPGSPPGIDIHATTRVAGSVPLAQRFADVVEAYGLDLISDVEPDGAGNSDQSSFWYYHYPAIMAAEDFSDWNPDYHSRDDVLGSLDMDYYADFVRAGLATFAHMGCLASGGIEGWVTDLYTRAPLAATIRMTGTLGMVYETTTGVTGHYTQTVLPDRYEVRVSAPGYAPAVAGSVEVGQGPTESSFRLARSTVRQGRGPVAARPRTHSAAGARPAVHW